MTTENVKQIHQGRNIKRFRELRGLKQDALAVMLGIPWTQKRISLLESKEEIDEDTIDQLAGVLNISNQAIKTFDENGIIALADPTHGEPRHFDPMKRLIELYEENKILYERLLASEQEKIALLKRMG
ncbi:helix-turn-helix domain-containing protein [Mucilaginibacter gracilis]|nr:helix-turn-helix transcriptional regulator [Mucilaginibacter gracilis]